VALFELSSVPFSITTAIMDPSSTVSVESVGADAAQSIEGRTPAFHAPNKVAAEATDANTTHLFQGRRCDFGMTSIGDVAVPSDIGTPHRLRASSPAGPWANQDFAVERSQIWSRFRCDEAGVTSSGIVSLTDYYRQSPDLGSTLAKDSA
jgi:hypothetical protein